ncbi:MAG: hypothetical protein FJW36_01370 [Acidobacteria bacterium]|nr:hypothetical protein [Acidobacteriota bacterium]
MRNSVKIPGPGYGMGRTPTGTRLRGIGRRQSIFSSLLTERYVVTYSAQYFNAKFGWCLMQQPIDPVLIRWQQFLAVTQSNQAL